MMRRTTISAPEEALATLKREARRRGVAITVLAAEALTEKAEAIRRSQRPRLGTAGSGGRSLGARQVAGDPVADDPS